MTKDYGVFIERNGNDPFLLEAVSAFSVAKQRAHQAAELGKVVSFVFNFKACAEQYRVHPYKVPVPLGEPQAVLNSCTCSMRLRASVGG
jgi:hypothetical protein